MPAAELPFNFEHIIVDARYHWGTVILPAISHLLLNSMNIHFYNLYAYA